MFSTQAKKFDVRILQFKPKLLKKDQLSDYPIGIEYNTDLLTDTQLIRKIFESNSYLPKKEFIIDFNYEISKILELQSQRDRRNTGTMLGMAVLGILGFFAFSFSLVGGIAGGVLGVVLGRYAGKKIVRKMKKKVALTEFELFTTKIECLLKWMDIEKLKCKFDLNSYRLVLEKVLQGAKLLFYYEHIPDKVRPKVLIKLIKKLRKVLLKDRNRIALYLSYKLFKVFMKDNLNSSSEKIAHLLNNIFIPLDKILSFQAKNASTINIKTKLKKLLNRSDVQLIRSKYPDPEFSEPQIKTFISHLDTKINLTESIFEFFGSNSFTRFFEPEIKTEKDPILAQLMKEDGWEEEEEVSLSSINEEDIDVETPRKISINQNDIRNLNSIKKREEEEVRRQEEDGLKEEGEEERRVEEYVGKREVGGGGGGGGKEDEGEEGFSFARNRRGEEFLKMPSSSGLDLEDGKKNLLQFVTRDLDCGIEGIEEGKEKLNSSKSAGKASDCLESEIEMNFQMIRDIVGEDVSTWDKVFKNKNLEVNRRKVPGSPCVLIKAKAYLENITCQTVFEQIYVIEKRTKWDTVFGEFKQIEQINESTDVIYFLINAPFGVTNRDFLQRRVFRVGSEDTIIQFKSVSHPMVPPRKNNVRAETYISGYIIRPDSVNKNITVLELVTQVDVKGSIPKAIVNYTASKAPIDWVNNLKKACLGEKEGGKFNKKN